MTGFGFARVGNAVRSLAKPTVQLPQLSNLGKRFSHEYGEYINDNQKKKKYMNC